MSFYFTNFPSFDWYDDEKKRVRVVDITKRYAFVDDVLKNRYVFYTYEVKEGERPDIIAGKYYGDASLDYLILLMNTLIDPFFEWPLSYVEFQEYIVKKYGSIETAQETTLKRYKILQEKTRNLDGTFVDERLVEVDATMYATLTDLERRTVSAYVYEKEQNDARRRIKLIDRAYMPQILKELSTVLNG